MKRAFFITSLFSFYSLICFGQEQMRRVDDRQLAQRVRIHQGRETGELTGREFAALNREQRMIRRSERLAEADGDVTRCERRRLHNQQERANRHIRMASLRTGRRSL